MKEELLVEAHTFHLQTAKHPLYGRRFYVENLPLQLAGKDVRIELIRPKGTPKTKGYVGWMCVVLVDNIPLYLDAVGGELITTVRFVNDLLAQRTHQDTTQTFLQAIS